MYNSLIVLNFSFFNLADFSKHFLLTFQHYFIIIRFSLFFFLYTRTFKFLFICLEMREKKLLHFTPAENLSPLHPLYQKLLNENYLVRKSIYCYSRAHLIIFPVLYVRYYITHAVDRQYSNCNYVILNQIVPVHVNHGYHK